MSKEKITNYADGSSPTQLEHFTDDPHDSENCVLCRMMKRER